MLSLIPSAWAVENEGDATPDNTSEEEPQNGLTGPCGATEDDTVAWALTENNDSLYCVTKTTGDTTSWRFYEQKADAKEGNPEKVQAYTLTISGEGAMADYARNTTPWGLKLAELLNEETTDNNVSDFCSPHITQVVFTTDSKVTYIGAHAFRSTSIRTFEFPASVESIGDYAFIMCRQLESITAPGSNANREFYVKDDVVYQPYDGGLALRFFPLAKWTGAYEIKDGVTALGSNSMQMAEFTSVTIPASVRSINSYAFNSTALTSVTFAAGCEPSFGTEFEDNELSPGAGAFSNCENLITINFPKNVTKLPNNLFSGDVSLTGFTILDGVTEIGNGAFANTGITEIEIPAGVTTIGSGVFSTSAPAEGEEPVRTSIAVNFEEGSKLASIGSGCFAGLDSYTATFEPADKEAYSVFAQAGYQVSLAGRTLPTSEYFEFGWVDENSVVITGLTEIGKTQENIVIPDKVTDIEENPYKVVGIGDSVFAGTANDGAHANTTLKSVKLGANIESIGGRAFIYCTGLTTVDFSEATSLKSIGNSAFYDTRVVNFDLSNTALTTVEDSAFRYGFSKTITIKLPDSITSWGKYVIDNPSVVVYAAKNSGTFETLTGVLEKGNDRFILGLEKGILAYQYVYKNEVASITIVGFASGVTDDLKKTVDIPDDIDGVPVTAVATYAFSDKGNDNYKKIEHVTIGKNVSQIGNCAFASSSGKTDGTLESVTFDEGVPVSVGTRAFQKYRNNFTTFDAGNRELTLGDNVFLGSSALTLINIPNVKSLGKGVFHGHENTVGTLIINGEATCDSLTFKDSTGSASDVNSLTKMTIYALGSASEVKDEVKALGGIDSNILCLTNGGVIDVTPQNVDATTGLYTPVYNGDGKVFDGWYDSNDQKLTNAASHGTYTAKWLDSAYTVAPTEVELSYTYGDETPTAGTVTVEASDTVASPDFTATTSSTYFTVTKNENMTFSVTPMSGLDAGEYEGTIVVTTGDSATYTVSVILTVAKKSIHVPSEDNTKYTYTGEDQTYQITADDAYTVTGNMKKDAGEYTVTIKLNDKDNTVWEGKDNADDLEYAFVIDKAAQDAPAAPTRKDRSYTSITLNEVAANDNGATAQYSVDGENWQPSPTFTGLTSGTTYTFYVRYAATDNYNASPASDAAEFSTLYRSSGGSSSSGRSYAVSAPSAKNGDVTVSPKNASKGDRVTITVTPDKGYELDSLTVKDASGNKLKLTDKGNGKYTFTMPGSKVTVSAEFVEEQAASIFADVPADAYYAKAVEWAVKKGITNGKANGLFGSNDPCTRAQIVTFLWRAAGSPEPKSMSSFSDVSADSYYAKAVAWAVENGITTGTGDGKFSPDATCTRAQSVTFLYRAMGTAPTTVNGFTDVAADSFCADAVAWAVENGVTNGTSASAFSPSNGCTRAQIVTFLFRAYQGK